MGCVASDKFIQLMIFEIDRAKGYYKKARENLAARDRANVLAAEVMASVYGAILEKIRKDPSQVLKGKVSLPRWLAILKVFQGWATNRLKL